MKKVLFILLLVCVFTARAHVITSNNVNASWALNSTWVGGVQPVSTDTVIIANSGGSGSDNSGKGADKGTKKASDKGTGTDSGTKKSDQGTDKATDNSGGQ